MNSITRYVAVSRRVSLPFPFFKRDVYTTRLRLLDYLYLYYLVTEQRHRRVRVRPISNFKLSFFMYYKESLVFIVIVIIC